LWDGLGPTVGVVQRTLRIPPHPSPSVSKVGNIAVQFSMRTAQFLTGNIGRPSFHRGVRSMTTGSSATREDLVGIHKYANDAPKITGILKQRWFSPQSIGCPSLRTRPHGKATCKALLHQPTTHYYLPFSRVVVFNSL